MKNLSFIIGIMICATAFFSCDYVTPTKMSNNGTVDTSTNVRKVLIEDYTGHTCGNCTHAADALDTFIGLYGTRIIPIAVHAGWFANPAAAPYTSNFETTVGTAWDTYFGMSAAGNPTGSVNRLGYPNSYPTAYQSWATFAAGILALTPAMNIKIDNSFASTSRSISATITSKYLQTLDSTYKISVVVTEDSIIDAQEFYYPTTHLDPAYVFKHMLRTSLNGTWGDTLSTGSQPMNAVFTKTYSLNLDTLYKANHCHLVAFIYNAITSEVVQAEMTNITK